MQQLQDQVNFQQQLINKLASELQDLRANFNNGNYASTQVFNKDVSFRGGVVFGDTRVTKFGLNLAPIARQAAITAPTTQTGSYVQADVQSIVTAVNTIRTRLAAFGLIS